MMAARGSYLLIALLLLLSAGQLAMADSICDFSYSNYARAAQLHDMGDYGAALRHYECALEADPDNGVIEILIDNVHADIAKADKAWSPNIVPAALAEAPAENLPETAPAEIAPPQVEQQPLRHTWMHSTAAIAVEREFALALDQLTTMILPVAVFTLEAGADDVPMLSLEAIRYLRYDSLEALRIYAWSRSIAYTQMTIEDIGGNTMLWLHTGEQHESVYSQAAWKMVAVSDVTERVHAALAQTKSADAEATDSDVLVAMPGVYASLTSMRMYQRQSTAALLVQAAAGNAIEPAPLTADDLIAQARAAANQENWQTARDNFERALELDPTRDRVRCELGMIYGMLGDDRAERYQHGCWRIMSSLPY